MAVVTIDQVRSRTRVDASIEQNVLVPLLAAVLLDWDIRTGRTWAFQQNVYEYHAPDGATIETLYSRIYPFTEVVEVATWSKASQEIDASIIDAAGYEVSKDRGSVRRIAGTWPERCRLKLSGGFDSEGAGGALQTPAEVVDAIIEEVLFRHQRQSGDNRIWLSKTGKGGGGQMAEQHSEIYMGAARLHKRLAATTG